MFILSYLQLLFYTLIESVINRYLIYWHIQINSIYCEDLSAPMCEDDIENCGYLIRGVRVIVWHVYINRSHYDISVSLMSKEECDFKVCIQKDGNISLYTLHQSFDNDKAMWTVVNVNNDVWSFNEAVSKSNSIDSLKKKIKD